MKAQKFIIFSLIFTTFLFFSCGTTKKIQPKSDLPEIEQPEEKPEIETQTENESELTEKIENEILPPEQDFPEEEKTEIPETTAESEKITEESVLPAENIEEKTEKPLEENIGSPKSYSEELENLEILHQNETETLPQTETENQNQNENENNQIAEKNQITENSSENLATNIEEKPLEQLENPQGTSKTSQIIEEIQEETQNPQTEETENEKIEPSRSVKIQNYQYLDIVYPGAGWIYLGQTDNKNDFIFYGRKLGGTDTRFTIRSKTPGTFILHFYKNDALTGNFIDDYLEVIVLEEKSKSNEHILAPSYAENVPQKYEQKTTSNFFTTEQNISEQNEQNAQDNIEETVQSENKVSETEEVPSQNQNEISEKENNLKSSKPKTFSNLSPEQLLEEAKKLYEQKDYENAKKALDNFLETSVSDIDEALFLQGQILETKSEIQNIKGAIDCYDLIVKKYPQSKNWSKANKRSIYLKRFYININ